MSGLARLPRLVATDLDGTLLDSSGEVSAPTRAALAHLERLGVPVVFVTARPLRWMSALWPLVGGHGTAIVSNGAVVYDVAARRVVEVDGIPADVGRDLVADLRRALPGATLGVEHVAGLLRGPGFPDADPSGESGPEVAVEELWPGPGVKLLVHEAVGDDAARRDALREGVVQVVGSRAEPTWTVPYLVEISAAGVTKGGSLGRLAAQWGIAPEEALAFGDMPNDLPMLRWAGASVAMAGGDPAVVAAADVVAPDHDDHGVARVLADVFGFTLPGLST